MGQELRLADIDAEAGAGMGIVEDAHGRATPAQFIDELKAGARWFHGAVGDAWLRNAVARREPVAKELETRIAAFLAYPCPSRDYAPSLRPRSAVEENHPERTSATLPRSTSRVRISSPAP